MLILYIHYLDICQWCSVKSQKGFKHYNQWSLFPFLDWKLPGSAWILSVMEPGADRSTLDSKESAKQYISKNGVPQLFEVWISDFSHLTSCNARLLNTACFLISFESLLGLAYRIWCNRHARCKCMNLVSVMSIAPLIMMQDLRYFNLGTFHHSGSGFWASHFSMKSLILTKNSNVHWSDIDHAWDWLYGTAIGKILVETWKITTGMSEKEFSDGNLVESIITVREIMSIQVRKEENILSAQNHESNELTRLLCMVCDNYIIWTLLNELLWYADIVDSQKISNIHVAFQYQFLLSMAEIFLFPDNSHTWCSIFLWLNCWATLLLGMVLLLHLIWFFVSSAWSELLVLVLLQKWIIGIFDCVASHWYTYATAASQTNAIMTDAIYECFAQNWFHSRVWQLVSSTTGQIFR